MLKKQKRRHRYSSISLRQKVNGSTFSSNDEDKLPDLVAYKTRYGFSNSLLILFKSHSLIFYSYKNNPESDGDHSDMMASKYSGSLQKLDSNVRPRRVGRINFISNHPQEEIKAKEVSLNGYVKAAGKETEFVS